MTVKKKLLSDHKQVGKKFYPPASLLGWTEIRYVEQILPEIVWLGYFPRVLGRRRGIDTVISFVETCFHLRDWESKPEFCFLSVYQILGDGDWERFRKALKAKDLFLQCLDCLTPFVRCYPHGNPFVRLWEGNIEPEPDESDINLTRLLLADLYDRRSKLATLVQSLVMWIDIKTGKHHVPTDYPYQSFNAILGDIDSEELPDAAPHVRMYVNSSHQYLKLDDCWARYFWNRGSKLTPLRADNEIPAELPEDAHPIVKLGSDYERYAWSVVDEIWSRLPVDIYESELFEVLGALLARQCNMAVKIASNIDLWDYHAGPLFLRPMTDCCITVAWILKGGIERARGFILYGLGQEKLEIERLRSVLDDQEGKDRESMEKRIAIQERWLESQHYAFLQHVDLGSWSGITTRKMAEEADCLGLYDFAYVSWSHAAHGTWNHIGRFDSFPSPEPLHKHIWQPVNFDHGHQVDVVVQATKYFDEVCVALVQEFKIEMGVPQPNEWLHDRLKEFFAGMQKLEAQETPLER